jgi:hypothetical protein
MIHFFWEKLVSKLQGDSNMSWISTDMSLAARSISKKARFLARIARQESWER